MSSLDGMGIRPGLGTRITKAVLNAGCRIFGRRSFWRLGRFLYLVGRDEIPRSENMAESGEIAVQRQLLKHLAGTSETIVVFDIGANEGHWTFSLLEEATALHIAGRLQIHAFEPVPATFELLKARFQGHRYAASIHFENRAVSHEAGQMEMFLTGKTAGTSSMYPSSSERISEVIQVPCTTLESYCSAKGIEVIHFLKCDTEGHDLEVIYGGADLIRKEKISACQIEYNHRWVDSRHYLKDVFDFVRNIPYQIGKVAPRRVYFYAEWHPELERFYEGNYLIVHNRALSWFSTEIGKIDIDNTYRTHQRFAQPPPS